MEPRRPARALVSALCWLLAGALLRCTARPNNTTTAQCLVNADCSAGFACVSSTCRELCTADSQCATGERCATELLAPDLSLNMLPTCVSSATHFCRYDSQCTDVAPNFWRCFANYTCGPECREDNDCRSRAHQFCDLTPVATGVIRGRCVDCYAGHTDCSLRGPAFSCDLDSASPTFQLCVNRGVDAGAPDAALPDAAPEAAVDAAAPDAVADAASEATAGG